jgi:hypothetical protein
VLQIASDLHYLVTSKIATGLWGLFACAVAVWAAELGSSPDASSPPIAQPHVVERSYQAMGTLLTLTAWTPDDAATGAAFEPVSAEFRRLEAMMTICGRVGRVGLVGRVGEWQSR